MLVMSFNPLKSGLYCNKQINIALEKSQVLSVSIPLNRVYIVIKGEAWFLYHAEKLGFNPLKSGLYCNKSFESKVAPANYKVSIPLNRVYIVIGLEFTVTTFAVISFQSP